METCMTLEKEPPFVLWQAKEPKLLLLICNCNFTKWNVYISMNISFTFWHDCEILTFHYIITRNIVEPPFRTNSNQNMHNGILKNVNMFEKNQANLFRKRPSTHWGAKRKTYISLGILSLNLKCLN